MKKYSGGISIIIPIHNEEFLLKKEIISLLKKTRFIKACEIILIENGSKDNTLKIARDLKKENRRIRLIRVSMPSCGLAIRKGIESSRYKTIVQFDLDLIDIPFLKHATKLLHKYDVIVGSKSHVLSSDQRPRYRVLMTQVFNQILRTYFGYKGTDTHGIKVYKKEQILPFLRHISRTDIFFDTEMLLLAQKYHLKIAELPISVEELRPTRFMLKTIIFQTVSELCTLLVHRFRFTKDIMPNISTDDYGLSPKVNRKTNLLMKRGLVKVVSVLPQCKEMSITKKVKIACHINLTDGRPILDRELVPSLVDRNGFFYSLPIFYLKLLFNNISFQEMQSELQAQVDRTKEKNILYEINSHMHIHALYPIDTIVSIIAKKNSIPHVRRYGNIRSHSLIGWILKNVLISFSTFEHSMYGKTLSKSPTWEKNKIPISFMSWETSYILQREKIEIVCHPGTSYDRNTKYLSLMKNRYR